jgi:hypothetical protein
MFRLAPVTSESFGVNVVHMDYIWLGDTVITGEFSTWLHGWLELTHVAFHGRRLPKRLFPIQSFPRAEIHVGLDAKFSLLLLI